MGRWKGTGRIGIAVLCVALSLAVRGAERPSRKNLVPDGALTEEGPAPGAPAGWTFNAWGENGAKGSWIESPGVAAGRALRIDMSNYRNGDAKWLFDRVRLAGGAWYSYSDLHRSDGRSRLVLSCREGSGGAVWNRVIGQTGASRVWRREEVRFYLRPGTGCEASLLHLIDRDGYLELARPLLAPAAPRPLPRPLVSLAFDDGWKGAVTTARADLEARHFVGSYYLVRSVIDHPSGRYASASDLRELVAAAAAKGHEIGSHAAHHKPLSLLPPGRIRAELKESLEWLSELGVDHPGIAYPFGDFDDRVEAQARVLYPYARTSLDGLNDAAVDRYRVRVLTVTTATDTASILAGIADAVRTSTWLVILFHDIGEFDPSNPYRTSRAQYLAVLDRLAAGDAAVVTVAGALRQLGP